MNDHTISTPEVALAGGPSSLDDGQHDAFVSYSRSDRERVRELVDALLGIGKRCWVDLEDIPPSAEWMSEVRGAIDRADAYIVMISPDFAASKVCAVELDHARTAGKRIVPVLVRPTDAALVPAELAALNWIDATNGGGLPRAAALVGEAIDQDLDHVKAHTRLLVRASEWERSERDKSLLLRGRELHTAEGVVASDRDPKGTPSQARFVVASRKAATARQRGAITVVTAAFLIAAVLGVVAFQQRAEALRNGRAATARALAAASQARIGVDPHDALLLAVDGYTTERTSETTAALRAALQADDQLAVLQASEASYPDVFTGPQGEREIPTVESVATGSDGRTVFTGGGDGVIARWSDPHAAPTSLGDVHGWVVSMEAMDDGRLAAAGHTGSLFHRRGFVWVLSEQGAVLKAEVDEDVDAMDVDGSGRSIVTAGPSGVITVWKVGHHSLQSRRHIHLNGRAADKHVFALALDPSGDRVAAGTASGLVVVYDVQSGRRLERVRAHEGAVTDAVYTPDGTMLITAGNDRLVRLWSASSLAPAGVLPHPVRVRAVAVSPSGVLAATIDNAGVGRVWDLPTQEVTTTLLGHERWGTDIAFLGDTEVVTAGADATARIWSVGPAAATETYHVDAYPGMPSAVAVAGGRIAVPGPGDAVTLIDEDNGHRSVVRPSNALGRTVGVAAASDGTSLVSVHEGGAVVLWDPDAGSAETLNVRENRWHPVGVAVSASGDQVLAFGYDDYSGGFFMSSGEIPDPPGIGVLIDLTGVHEDVWFHDDATFDAGAISPDESLLATISNLSAQVRASADGQWIDILQMPASWVESDWSAVAFSSDGRLLASSEPQGVLALYDATAFGGGDTTRPGPLLRVQTGHSALSSVDFSPTGALMATAGVDGTVRVWSAGDEPSPILDVQAGSSQQGLAGVKFAQPDVFKPVAVSFIDEHRIVVATGSGLVRVYACEACVGADELPALGEEHLGASGA